MKIKKIISFFKKMQVMILFLLIFVFVATDLSAQYSYNNYIYIEEPKSFIDLLFHTKQSKIYKQKEVQDIKSDTNKAIVKTDSTKPENRIESLRDGGDIFYLYLVLSDRESPIKIIVYNMLGKRVLDVYNGYPKPKSNPYEISIDGPPPLPNGVYLCVVIGKNFRLREKFVVAR